MTVRIEELRDRQVICVKNGALLGTVGDIELDITTGKLSSIVIFGKPKGFGLFGRDDDIIISWDDIEIIGNETILVKTC